MKPETALIQMHSWAQEESAAQGRLLAALEHIDEAARGASNAELTAGCDELEEVLGGVGPRAQRRARLANILALHFGVSPTTLSLGSIVERAQATQLGSEGVLGALASLRVELVGRVQEVSRRAKLMSVVAGHQRGVLNELLAILSPSRPRSSGADAAGCALGSSRSAGSGGNLVNAEA